MRYAFALFLSAILAGGAFGQARRVADLTEAKDLMAQSDTAKLATAVFLHGSDWCPAGEIVKANAWDAPTLAASLPAPVMLVAVDHPEEYAQKLRDDLKTRLSTSEPNNPTISVPLTKNGTVFETLESGAWQVAKDSPNPAQEALTLTLRLDRPTTLFRLVTETHSDLPATGPGRATNGNFVITEIELHSGDQSIPLHATATYSDKSFPASRVCDIDLTPDNGWSVSARHGNHELFLIPESPLPAATEFKITIRCISKHKQHTLGRFRIEAFDDSEAATTLKNLTEFERLESRNKALPASTSNYPAIVVIDSKGRPVGSHQPIPADATPQALAQQIIDILQVQKERDNLLTAAETAEGAAKIEPMAKAYLLMQEAGQAGHYKDLHQQILKADPDRTSSWTWRVALDRGGMGKEQSRILKEEGEQAALDYIDSLLADPRAKKLTSDQKQDLALMKFHIFRSWKEHEQKRFDVLREIITTDPTTHLGIGAKGYIDLHSEGEASIAFGWKPSHLTHGEQHRDIREGVDVAFHRPAHYRVTLTTRSAAKPVEVKSVSLIAGDRELSRDEHPGILAKGADENNIFEIELPEGVDPASLILRIHLDAPTGHEHSANRIKVEPVLPADGEFGWK